MSMREKKKPERKGGKDNTSKPPEKQFGQRTDSEIHIKRNVSAEQLEKQRRERESIVKPDEKEIGRKISQEWDELSDEEKKQIQNSGLRQPWKGHMVKFDPRTGEPRYRGQKPDSELPNGRTVTAEELAKRREPERKGGVSASEEEKSEKRKTHAERAQERFDDFMREVPKDPKDSS